MFAAIRTITLAALLATLAACNQLQPAQSTQDVAAPATNTGAVARTSPALPQLASLPGNVDTAVAINAAEPLAGSDGEPMSSGLAMFADNTATLISRQGDTATLEWMLYGIGGLDPASPPDSIEVVLDDVRGSVQAGVAGFGDQRWHFKHLPVAGSHELSLAGIQPVSSGGALYLAIGVSGGSSAVFSGASLPDSSGELLASKPVQAETASGDVAEAEPAENTTPATATKQPGDEAGGQLMADSSPPDAQERSEAVPEPVPAAGTEAATPPTDKEPSDPAPAAPVESEPDTIAAAYFPATGLPKETASEAILPVSFPAMNPYDFPAQYERLSEVIHAAQPAEDSAGWPLSSGMTRFAGELALLTSVKGDSSSLEWIAYGGSGFSPVNPPGELNLAFDRIDGAVWLGLPDYQQEKLDWQMLEPGEMHRIDLAGRDIVREDGELFFVLGVAGGNFAAFSGGYIAASSGIDLLGTFLSHGYWNPANVREQFSQLNDLGVNFIVDYALLMPEDEEWTDEFDAYLAAADEQGLQLAYCLFPLLKGATPQDAEAQFEQVLKHVNALKDQPAITAWYVHDEVLPLVAGEGGTEHYTLSLEQMQELYQRIKAADPGRPQINTWAQLPTRQEFNEMFTADFTPHGRALWMDREQLYEATMQEMVRTTCDWVFIDYYPVGAPWLAGKDITPRQAVRSAMQRAASLRSPEQPLYFVFQSFSHAQYGYGPAAQAQFPDSAQMRDMIFASRIHGAQGLLAYSWFDLTRTDLPGRDIPGREECLAGLREVLAGLRDSGWPVPEPEGGSVNAE